MADPDRISVDLVLCDWAEVQGGKVYIQGAGWVRIGPNQQNAIAIAALIHVPFSLTNRKHQLGFSLVDEDGRPFPPIEDPGPFQVDGEFEVGRPPGMRPGEASIVPFAAKLIISFPEGGYAFVATINDEEVARVPFVSREG